MRRIVNMWWENDGDEFNIVDDSGRHLILNNCHPVSVGDIVTDGKDATITLTLGFVPAETSETNFPDSSK